MRLIELAKCTDQTHYIVTITRANLNRSEHYSIHLASVRPPLLRSESWEVLEPKPAVLGRRQCTPQTSQRENIQTPHRKAAGTNLQPFCCKGDSVNPRLALHPQTTILRMQLRGICDKSRSLLIHLCLPDKMDSKQWG